MLEGQGRSRRGKDTSRRIPEILEEGRERLGGIRGCGGGGGGVTRKGQGLRRREGRCRRIQGVPEGESRLSDRRLSSTMRNMCPKP